VPDEDSGVAADLEGHTSGPAEEALDQAEVCPERQLRGRQRFRQVSEQSLARQVGEQRVLEVVGAGADRTCDTYQKRIARFSGSRGRLEQQPAGMAGRHRGASLAASELGQNSERDLLLAGWPFHGKGVPQASVELPLGSTGEALALVEEDPQPGVVRFHEEPGNDCPSEEPIAARSVGRQDPGASARPG
jgi:hypothetical protein